MYSGVKKIFRRYWEAYGGKSALLSSPYLHLAAFLLVLTFHYWSTEKWWEQGLLVLPNLLGFSLGGFAMFLGFGDEKFRILLAESNDDRSPSAYMKLCSSFVHFILIQFLALICAILARAFDFYFPWPEGLRQVITTGTYLFSGTGYLLFLYSITSMLAATMTVFRTCSWYELHQKNSGN